MRHKNKDKMIMRYFKVHENGKLYKVSVRMSYQDTIKSERQLRKVVSQSMLSRYGIDNKPLFESCELLGILGYCKPKDKMIMTTQVYAVADKVTGKIIGSDTNTPRIYATRIQAEAIQRSCYPNGKVVAYIILVTD